MSIRTQYIAGGALLLLIAAAAIFSALASAPQPRFSEQEILFAPIEEVPNPFRKILWLNGKWEFRTKESGDWSSVVVPHVWNSVPGLENYEGRAEYRLFFEIDEDWADETPTLHFEGVAGSVEVVVNDIRVATRAPRDTPLAVDISEHAVSPGRNELRVIVDNAMSRGTPRVAGEKVFGGIFREVYVEFSRPLRVENMTAGADAAKPGAAWATSTARVAARFAIPGGDAQVFGRINLEDGWGGTIFDALLTSDAAGYAAFEWRGDLPGTILWSPNNPQRYKAGLVSVTPDGLTDGAQKIFGVRDFSCGKDGFRLNGEPIKLRGVVWREQFGDGWGPVATQGAAERDIALIRAAGFNAVRFTRPPHPALLEMCDKAGLLVFEELPLGGKLPRGDAAYAELERMLEEIVARDESHPSIVAWGLGADIDARDAATRKIIARLSARLKKIDPSRCVYAGTRGLAPWKAPESVDFYAFTEYVGWTGRSASAFKRALASKRLASADIPIALLAYGAGARADAPIGAAGLKGSQLHQYFAIAGTEAAINAAPNVAGGFLDSLADYEGPSLRGPNRERNIVHTGLLGEDRKPKLAYQQLSGAGSADDISWRWSRLRFRFPGAEFALLALAALAGFAIWSGFGKTWQAFVEPEELRPVDVSPRETAKNFLLFGLPMLAAGAAAMSFAASAALDLRPLDPALASPGAMAAVRLWIEPFPARLALMFALQLAAAAGVALTSAAVLSVEPFKMFELLTRCSALRMLFIAAPFMPFPLWAFAAAIAGWEIFIQIGATERAFGDTPTRTAVAVGAGVAATAAALAALALFVLNVIL